jgi:hypothetical protein
VSSSSPPQPASAPMDTTISTRAVRRTHAALVERRLVPRPTTPRRSPSYGREPTGFWAHGAAMESNHPSVGLPRPAGFEDQHGLAYQPAEARAARGTHAPYHWRPGVYGTSTPCIAKSWSSVSPIVPLSPESLRRRRKSWRTMFSPSLIVPGTMASNVVAR